MSSIKGIRNLTGLLLMVPHRKLNGRQAIMATNTLPNALVTREKYVVN